MATLRTSTGDGPPDGWGAAYAVEICPMTMAHRNQVGGDRRVKAEDIKRVGGCAIVARVRHVNVASGGLAAAHRATVKRPIIPFIWWDSTWQW